MTNRQKPAGLRELEDVAALIEEAAFHAGADELWERIGKPTVLEFAASGREVPTDAGAVDRKPPLAPQKLETLILPLCQITFYTSGEYVYVSFPAHLSFSVLSVGAAKTELPLRTSEAYPGLFEVGSVTTFDVEQFLENHHRAPNDFPIAIG